jgi:hypothetical protein
MEVIGMAVAVAVEVGGAAVGILPAGAATVVACAPDTPEPALAVTLAADAPAEGVTEDTPALLAL